MYWRLFPYLVGFLSGTLPSDATIECACIHVSTYTYIHTYVLYTSENACVHVQVVDDGELGLTQGLKLPEAIKQYEKDVKKDRAEIAKILTVFPDKGILGGGYSFFSFPPENLCLYALCVA
jgi:hypothetical protein